MNERMKNWMMKKMMKRMKMKMKMMIDYQEIGIDRKRMSIG